MAPSPLSPFLRHRSSRLHFPFLFTIPKPFPFSTASLPSSPNPLPSDPKSTLSARLSFVFDQIDALGRDRDQSLSQKDEALARIRSWRQSKPPDPHLAETGEKTGEIGERGGKDSILKQDVEVVHPWPEWIELMERLGQQRYFELNYRRGEEEEVAERVGIDLEGVKEEVGLDFSRDWTTVRNACMNFGRDRFDILRSLSRSDLQILVGHGCPSMDSKVVFSAKLLRKYVRLDEGDVCSSCSLRNSCSRGYILTLKEDEARTIDVMRILLTYGFDHVKGSVENKPLMKMKSVKTVVRKLLHEVVKLSAVPIDPNLPPPVIKKAPPKVKQPPPPPKKRVGRDDVEMKKGDWLCAKCDFMNFAKNTVCLQCDAKRPKRQLLPGEWECPQCNFLNYRRNMACFNCDAKRPHDEYMESQIQTNQFSPRTRLERVAKNPDVSNAWNFDFDDNESDGADVAAFEFADSSKMADDSSVDMPSLERNEDSSEDDMRSSKMSRVREKDGHFRDHNERKSSLQSQRTGFDDFDDEEDDDDDVNSYELDGSNNNRAREVSRMNFSEIEDTSGSEDSDDCHRHTNTNQSARDYISGSEDDDLADHPQLKSSHVSDSWPKGGRRGGTYPRREKSLSSDDDDSELDSDSDDDADEGFRSAQTRSRRQNSASKGNRRARGLDSDDDGPLLDSDSDGDDEFYSGRNKMRGNKGLSDRRTNNFRKHGADTASREFRSDDRKNSTRNSFSNRNDDFSSRGSRGRGYGGRRDNDRSQHFDRLDNGDRMRRRTDQFNDRSRGSWRDERGFRGNGGSRRDERGNDRSHHFDRLDNGDRFRRRTEQFNDRSRGSQRDERGFRGNGGSRRDERGFRGNGYGGGRGNGRGRHEGGNDFGDRSFIDDDRNDRPRRVIER